MAETTTSAGVDPRTLPGRCWVCGYSLTLGAGDGRGAHWDCSHNPYTGRRRLEVGADHRRPGPVDYGLEVMAAASCGCWAPDNRGVDFFHFQTCSWRRYHSVNVGAPGGAPKWVVHHVTHCDTGGRRCGGAL